MRACAVAALIIACLVPAALAGQGASARASVDRNSILIGDRIKYTLEVTAAGKSEAELPAFKDGMIGDFEIKDSGGGVKSGWFGKRTLYRWYSVTIYSTGKQVIPEVEVKYRPKGVKDWISLKTKPVTINVASVLPKAGAKDIKDIKGPLVYFEVNWLLVAFLLALGLLSALGIRSYLRMRNRPPVRLPHETALEELEAARALFLKDNDVKEYFAAVSDCVRRYVERVFSLKAPEQTTEEFLNSLGVANALSIGQKELLRDFLNACDLVKFAKYAASRDEADNVYTTAKGFVEETSRALAGNAGTEKGRK